MANKRGLEAAQLGQRSRAGDGVDGARVRGPVPLADVTQRARAGRRLRDGVDDVDVPAVSKTSRRDGGGHGVEVVALKQDPSVPINIESVAPNVLEVIVNAVEQVLAARRVGGAHMRRSAGNIVQPVAGESVVVLGTNKQGRPVVLPVAASRPLRLAVELGVGDGNLASGAPPGHDELAADEGDLAVVDPDLVGAVEGDGVAAPDVLRVEVGDVDVLDDDVALAAADAQALADDDALGPDADDGLVAVHVYG